MLPERFRDRIPKPGFWTVTIGLALLVTPSVGLLAAELRDPRAEAEARAREADGALRADLLEQGFAPWNPGSGIQLALQGVEVLVPLGPFELESGAARLSGHAADRGAAEAALRTLCIDAARAELLTPRTVMESIHLTRIGPAEIDRHRDGISINAPFLRLVDALGGFDRTQPPASGSTAYRQMMDRFEGHSRTAMGFVWLSTSTAQHAAAGTTRRAEVNAGRAYMRLQLKATELGLQMHPMSQAPQEFAEMRGHYDKLHDLLVGAPAATRTVQMFCRIGYSGPVPPTPRRGVDAILRPRTAA